MRAKLPTRLTAIALFFLTALAAGLLWFWRGHPVHPEFGVVSQSSMAEQPSAWQQAKYLVKKTFGLPRAERISLLRIGSAPLEWSAGGGRRKGFLYTNHPLLNNTPLWEFALSPHTRLADVCSSDLPSDYYGMNDPRGSNAFGTNWIGHALRVAEGQIFFARLATNRSVVYVIHLVEQGQGRTRGRMRVEYLTVTNQPTNRITGPDAGSPRQFPVRAPLAAR